MEICCTLELERLVTVAHLLLTFSHAREDPRQALTAHTSNIIPGPLSPPPQGIFGSSGASLPRSRGVARPSWEPLPPTPAHEPLSRPPRLCWLPPHPEAPAPRPIPVPFRYPVRSHLEPHADAMPPARSARSLPARSTPAILARPTSGLHPPGRPAPPAGPTRLTCPAPPDRNHPIRHHGPRPHGPARPPPDRPAPPTSTSRSGRPTPAPHPPTDPSYGYRLSWSGYLLPARMAAAVSASARSDGSGTVRPSTCHPHSMNRTPGPRPAGPRPPCPSSYRRSAFMSSDRWPSDIRPLGTYP